MNTVSFVIGSWGSYNECNERALGSKWLDFDEYEDWDAIVEELKQEGFELDGIDEELFVQDIEGIPTSSKDWDNTHPKVLLCFGSYLFSDFSTQNSILFSSGATIFLYKVSMLNAKLRLCTE